MHHLYERYDSLNLDCFNLISTTTRYRLQHIFLVPFNEGDCIGIIFHLKNYQRIKKISRMERFPYDKSNSIMKCWIKLFNNSFKRVSIKSSLMQRSIFEVRNQNFNFLAKVSIFFFIQHNTEFLNILNCDYLIFHLFFLHFLILTPKILNNFSVASRFQNFYLCISYLYSCSLNFTYVPIRLYIRHR